MQTFLYLLCYDISEDATRSKVADLLESYGGTRRNKSVFELSLSASEKTDLWQKIAHQIDPQTDNVLCYQVCIDCYSQSSCLPEEDLIEGNTFV